MPPRRAADRLGRRRGRAPLDPRRAHITPSAPWRSARPAGAKPLGDRLHESDVGACLLGRPARETSIDGLVLVDHPIDAEALYRVLPDASAVQASSLLDRELRLMQVVDE